MTFKQLRTFAVDHHLELALAPAADDGVQITARAVGDGVAVSATGATADEATAALEPLLAAIVG